MRRVLLLSIILSLVLVILMGTLLCPPYKDAIGIAADTYGDSAMQNYFMKRLGIALAKYPGRGNLVITLEEEPLNQILVPLFEKQLSLPKGIKYSGAFLRLRENRAQLGCAFRFLFLPLVFSCDLDTEFQGNLILSVTSVKIGRIPFPTKFATSLVSRYVDMPELDGSRITIPVKLDDYGLPGVVISDLKILDEKIEIGMQIQGVTPSIPDSARDNFSDSVPEIQGILEDNPLAQEKLIQLQELVSSGAPPLQLLMAAAELYNALDHEELSQLEKVLDEEIRSLLEQVRDRF